MYGGGTVWFADKTALQGSLVDTLKETRPTIFIGRKMINIIFIKLGTALSFRLKILRLSGWNLH